jgi:hypothetical protein
MSTERTFLLSRERRAAVAVALIASISLLGACSSEDSSGKLANQDRRAVTATKAAAARNRAAVARRRTAAAKRRATPTTRVPTTTTTIVTAAVRRSDDLAAIRKTVDALNAAFLAGVSSGITNSTTANYWVDTGTYTDDQCASFESARGQGIVSEHIVTRALESAPGWIDPMTGRVPRGRIYRMTVDEVQTLVTTGQQRARTHSIPVIVRPDGHAQLFLRCH